MGERRHTWQYVGGPFCGANVMLSYAEAYSVRREFGPDANGDMWLAAYRASGVDAYRLEYLGMQKVIRPAVPPT